MPVVWWSYRIAVQGHSGASIGKLCDQSVRNWHANFCLHKRKAHTTQPHTGSDASAISMFNAKSMHGCMLHLTMLLTIIPNWNFKSLPAHSRCWWATVCFMKRYSAEFWGAYSCQNYKASTSTTQGGHLDWLCQYICSHVLSWKQLVMCVGMCLLLGCLQQHIIHMCIHPTMYLKTHLNTIVLPPSESFEVSPQHLCKPRPITFSMHGTRMSQHSR